MVDKGVVVRVFRENQRLKFRKRVVLIRFNSKDLAGIEFHHEKVELLDDVEINDFVEVNYNIKGKVGSNENLYNNLIGNSITKI